MGFSDMLKSLLGIVDINKEVLNAPPGSIILDVRERDEYAGGHILGSVNLPLSEIDKAERVLSDKSAHILIYCLSGARSGRAEAALKAMGYADVKSIGGISAYKGRLE